MIIKFSTETGSEYEYDTSTPHLVRRVRGVRRPTEGQAQDGEWYQCDAVTALGGGKIEIGSRAIIWWGANRYAFLDGLSPTTITSNVTSIAVQKP